MLKEFKYWQKSSLLIYAWILTFFLIITQLFYIIICKTHSDELPLYLTTDTLVIWRSLFYLLSILLFPITKLLRYIQIRLNQTMPGNKPAANRYLFTIIISQGLMGLIGSFGLILCILGDTINSLYIFSGLAWLGFLLNRPKKSEYQSIVIALNSKN